MHQRKLSELASAEIDELRDQGMYPTDQDIVTINALAWEIQNPTNEILSARGEPVRIPGAVLWPLTLQASDWWSDYGKWFTTLDEQTKALGFLMAHGRRVCLRSRLATRSVARRAVFAWGRHLPCTFAQLQIAVGSVLEQMRTSGDDTNQADEEPDRTSGGEPDRTSSGELIAFLVSSTGLDAEYWERRVSVPFINEQVRVIVKQLQVDDKPSKDDPRIIAERNMGFALKEIKERLAGDGRATS